MVPPPPLDLGLPVIYPWICPPASLIKQDTAKLLEPVNSWQRKEICDLKTTIEFLRGMTILHGSVPPKNDCFSSTFSEWVAIQMVGQEVVARISTTPFHWSEATRATNRRPILIQESASRTHLEGGLWHSCSISPAVMILNFFFLRTVSLFVVIKAFRSFVK